MQNQMQKLLGPVVISLATITGDILAAQHEVAWVRAATAPFHRTEAAETTGYHLIPGLDHCFDNPGVGAMGYHYINLALLDLIVDALQPEALVYAPAPNGNLRLAAVEYIVPAEAWHADGNDEPPVVLGRHMHLDATGDFYILHAWIWRVNPLGMFEDWNPTVTCD